MRTLLIPNVLEVPLSNGGCPATPPARQPATTQKYLPSTLVPPPAPTVPDAPTNLVATGYLTSMQVSWTAPVNNGGSQIDGYTFGSHRRLGTPSTCGTVSTYDVRSHRFAAAHELHVHRGGEERCRHLCGLGAVRRQADGPAHRRPAWAPGDPLPALPARIADHRLRADRPRPQSRSTCPATSRSRRAGSGCRTRTVIPSSSMAGCWRRRSTSPIPVSRFRSASRTRSPKARSRSSRRRQRVSAHGVECDRPGQPGRRATRSTPGKSSRLDAGTPLSRVRGARRRGVGRRRRRRSRRVRRGCRSRRCARPRARRCGRRCGSSTGGGR